jgi:glycosyltransferase involved in cell wall biosynthesis
VPHPCPAGPGPGAPPPLCLRGRGRRSTPVVEVTLRIAVFTGHFHPHVGGVERYTRAIFSRLVRRGHEVVLVTSVVGGGPERETVDGIEVVRLPVLPLFSARFPVPLPGPRLLGAMSRVRRFRPEAVVTNTRFFPASWLGTWFARAGALPHLHVEHGSGHVRLGHPLADRLAAAVDQGPGRWVVRHASRCVGVSGAVVDFLARLGRPDAGLLSNGVDLPEAASGTERAALRARLGVGPDQPLALYAGRVTADKGVLVLLEALARLPEVHLVVAGDGEALEELRRRAARVPRLHLLGQVAPREVLRLLTAADLFVHPSCCAEGLPSSILEAAAAGVAIVATPQGGTVEVVCSPDHGLLVPPGDAVALADAMSRLVADPALRARLGAAARRLVAERFGWDRIAEAAEGELLALAGTRPCLSTSR